MPVWDKFDKGLYIAGRPDAIPPGTMRRFKGVESGNTTAILSRNGATRIETGSAHSLTRFGDLRFSGIAGELHRGGSKIKSGLDGTRLTFARLQPTVAVTDQLFCVGGGDAFKVGSGGNVTQLGIVVADTAPTVATGAAGSLSGTYTYRVTFLNTESGTRSDGTNASASVSPSSEVVDLTAIPTSADPQVDAREIWRIQNGGSTYYLLTTINDNTTTTYTDNTTDANLSSTTLPLDNGDLPVDTFEDIVGPYDGRAWYGRNTLEGERGRIYFTPSGRMEVLDSFIDLTEDDDPHQKNVVFGGSLFAFTESKIFQIAGTGTEGIFNPIEFKGVPGTNQPHTVVPTPIGIIYQAHDSIRVFNGVVSTPLAEEPLEGIFTGETREHVAGFVGVVACYNGKEYVISNTTHTLACDLAKRTWRDLGVGANALYFEEDTGATQISFSNKVYTFEDNGVASDDGTAISFEVQTPSVNSGEKDLGLARRLYISADTGGQSLTPSLVLDNSVVALPPFSTTSRETVEWVIMRSGRTFGIRIEGNVSAKVKIYKIDLDVYVPNNNVGGN